ncbi:BON domain-containing protein [Paraburkholderia pallida]|uniref:BON domain-containing protein n=1 Tax=Paraburkholderia pallida TaxID=2547399 RepID=A0A4P7DAH0_9BURK|nr:BON domain-containing protein [Paraburkholderia pallida]QBR03752.1 BON domain-containing protein [Paraburkholderia pallida]
MKFRKTLLLGALPILFATGVYAQAAGNSVSSEVTATSAQSAKPTRAERKAIRVQNRAFAKTVSQAIFKDHELDGSDIAVFANAKTGSVVLAGYITDESQDQKAQDVARKVHGVTSVTSKLTLEMEGS